MVEFAFDKDSVHQGVAFLQALPKKSLGLIASTRAKKKSDQTKADMLVRLQSYARKGKLTVPGQMNYLTMEDGCQLMEFKAGNLRLPFYETTCKDAQIARITHGFFKASERAPLKELRKGHAIAKEDRKR